MSNVCFYYCRTVPVKILIHLITNTPSKLPWNSRQISASKGKLDSIWNILSLKTTYHSLTSLIRKPKGQNQVQATERGRDCLSSVESKRREYLSSYRPILWSITNHSRRMCPVRCRLYEYEFTQFLYSTETQPVLRISRTGDRENKQCKIKQTNKQCCFDGKEGLI